MTRKGEDQLNKIFKRCNKCGKLKALIDYYKNKSNKSGFSYWCKNCDIKIKRKYARRLRIEILEKLGGKCANCGYNGVALQIDHINGWGRQETTKIFKSRTSFYRKLLSLDIEILFVEYQLLCANCNWEKRYTYNEHNHYYYRSDINEEK